MTRVLLRDLIPGQDYLMQFRSNNGINVSEWSQVFKFKTNGDVTPPSDPTNLTWVPTGESFVGTWTAPTTNSNGTPLKDLKDYEVTVEANSKTKVYYTVDNTFNFTLVMNAEAFGGIELTVKITVKARDLSLNKSAGVSLTKTEDTPPTPSAPVVTNTMGQLTVEWDGSTTAGVINPFNLEYVAIHASTTTNFTPSATNLVGRFEGWLSGKQRTIVPGLTYGQLYYFKLVSVNKKGKTSPASAQASGTATRVTGLDIDANAQLSASQMNFSARQLGGANAFYGTTTPTGTTAPDGTTYKDGDIFYNTAVPPAANAGKTYRRTAGSWVEDSNIGVISGSKLLANTVTASAIGTNLIITSQANIGNAVIDDANIGNIKAGKIVAEDTATNTIISNTAQIKDAIISSAKIINLSADKIRTGSLQADQKIIAGPENSDHAEMSDRGFRVYTNDQVDGTPREVIRMGTDTNDFFGVVDSLGNLVASVDDTGRASFTEINTPSLYVAGREIAQVVSNGPRGEVAHFLGTAGFDFQPIFNPVGVAEVGLRIEKGRSYHIKWRMSVFVNAGVQAQVNGRYTQGVDGNTTTEPAAPVVNSTSFAEWKFFPAGDNKTQTIAGEAMFLATRTTRIRFGFTIQTGPDGAVGNVGVRNAPVEINVLDVGIHGGRTGQFTNMGGSLNTGTPSAPPPASVTQQYFVDLAPAGRASWQGNGQLMTWAGNDVYQGYNSTNGNTRGQFWFNLPNITGSVDRVDLWVYFRHWYFNSGGTMRLGITDQRGAFTDHSFRTPWETGGWPKPGGREIGLPLDWFSLFKGTDNNSFNGRGTCFNLGPGVGNNQIYYGVATDARLRIYYTQ